MTAERVKSSEVRRSFARMIHGVASRPVEILHHGERAAVLISPTDFDELKYLRGLYETVGKLRQAR